MINAANLTGGCLCNGVRFCLKRKPTQVFYCHCHQCQKAQGGAFAAAVPVLKVDFELVSGADLLRAYRASANKARNFCVRCGSPVFSEVDGAATLRIRAGTLDDATSLQGAAHIFTADKVAWYEIHDDLPQYAEREPGRRQ